MVILFFFMGSAGCKFTLRFRCKLKFAFFVYVFADFAI